MCRKDIDTSNYTNIVQLQDKIVQLTKEYNQKLENINSHSIKLEGEENNYIQIIDNVHLGNSMKAINYLF